MGQDDELLDIALARRRDPAGAKHALTVLTRLARRDPSQQRLLSRALDRHLADHLQQSLEVGSETGAPMAGIIMETVRGKPRAAARQIIVPLLQAIPKDTINLRDLAAAIAQINVEILGDKAKSKRGAKMSMKLLSGLEEAAERYEAVGDWTRAAAARQRLFEQARSLYKPGNPSEVTRLGIAHDDLATALGRIGDFEQALKHALEAEAGFRRLAERHPAEHQGNWATSLANLASHLSDLGRFEEAIDKAQAAEQIRRELAERQPDAYRADWATSLANLANHLSDLGRFEEAIDKAQAAEHIRRELAERQPDANRADWAWALGVLAESQLDDGDLSEANSIATQALHQFALLGQERLRLLADDLGGAHRIHGEALLGRGHASEGLSAASVSVEILRGVFDQRPPVAAEQLAKATLVKARCLRKLDKPREAARAITEALTLLLPLIEPYRAKLRRVVRDMLGELAETSPESLPAEPAAKVARLLDEERTAEAGGDPS